MTEIAGYEILRKLGSGAGGTVYLANQRSLGRQVALKVLSSGHFEDEEARSRFLNEAHILCRLSHPCVVEVYDADFAGQNAFIAMQYLEKGCLRHELLQFARLPLDRVARVGAEAARGLHHAHQAGVIHRDVKPENLFLGADGAVKVGDFGLARSDSKLAAVQTQDGYVVGTPGFIAPEVLAGGAVTPAADTWALGITLFELATGTGPELRAFREAQARSSLQASLPAPSSLLPELPAEFDALIADCLAGDPAARPPLPVLIKRLEKLELSLRSTRSVPVQERGGAPGHSEGRRRLAIALALGLAAIAALAANLAIDRPAGRSSRQFVPDPATELPPLEPGSPSRPGPPSTGLAAPPGAKPVSPATPLLRMITTGSDRARMVFADPLPEDTQYRVFDLDRGGGLSVQAAAGATSVLIAGLRHGCRYEARPEGEEGPGYRFQTWQKRETPSVIKLAGTGWGASYVAVARAGDRVGVLAAQNDRPGSRVLFFESLDGGRTWSSARELARAAELPAPPWLAMTRGRFLAAWYAGNETAPRVWSSWRRLDAGAWSPPKPVLSSAMRPALVLDAEGKAKAIVSLNLANGGVKLQLVEFDCFDGEESSRQPGPEPGPLKPGMQRLADTATGLAWCFRAYLAHDRKLCYWATRSNDSGNWTPVKPVDPGATDSGLMGLLPVGKLVLVAYETKGKMRALCLPVGGTGSFPVGLLPPPHWACSAPAVAAHEGLLGLAFMDAPPGLASPQLRLYLSEDGLNWRLAASQRLLLTAPRSLDLALTGSSANVAVQDEVEGLIVVRQDISADRLQKQVR